MTEPGPDIPMVRRLPLLEGERVLVTLTYDGATEPLVRELDIERADYQKQLYGVDAVEPLVRELRLEARRCKEKDECRAGTQTVAGRER